MAEILNNVFPGDVNDITSDEGSNRRALSFDFPLSGRAVFNQNFTTPKAIQANLVNWLLTNKGERVFNPNFGANLRELLFEGVVDSTTSALQTRITDNISIEFPMIKVKKVEFDNDTDSNTIIFNMSYEIQNFGIIDDIVIEIR